MLFSLRSSCRFLCGWDSKNFWVSFVIFVIEAWSLRAYFGASFANSSGVYCLLKMQCCLCLRLMQPIQFLQDLQLYRKLLSVQFSQSCA